MCEDRDPNPLWSRLVREVNEQQYDLVADLLIGELGSPRFYDLLREAVGPLDKPARSSLLRNLGEIPFAGVITNVWDHLAQDVFKRREPTILDPESTPEFAEVLRGGDFFILNAYGSLARNTLLLTSESFENYLSDHSDYARFLGSLFVTRTMLFVGTGVAGIEDVLRSSGVRAAGNRRHYAVVPWTTEAELHRERLKRRFNVELVLYTPSAGHPDVDAFVASLRKKVADRRRHVPVAARPAGVPLASVWLENIGPFDSLHLELDPSWSVILGDNGCGKSTVLRAVALALCGDDERAVRGGGALLNANAQSGTIQVQFGKDVFETKLTRERSRVRVTPRQITPVQTGQWLVLGFPPLRGASLRTPDPPAERSMRAPSVDDVLPLLTSDIDSRLDDLTQWLLNAIYADAATVHLRRGGTSSTSIGPPSRVTQFFNIMSRLAGGERVYTYAGVDTDTLDVLVDTPDGTVPLTLLSQGMSSVLCWTGTVISRLEELGRTGDTPNAHVGLALVDEIDAHLHPSWQRTILDAVRDEFPGLQVVATTHSPLVVGSMRNGKLYRLARDQDKRINCENLLGSFAGWRADQILSGPAFDTSPRDRETERLLDDYARLASRDDLAPGERIELDKVAHQLEVRLPTSEQREEARKARQLIETAAAKQIEAMPLDERERVLAELRLQVQEAITGSGPRA
ncbi:MAG: AAA family ATPase [Solirubrobacteraceae bacterium]